MLLDVLQEKVGRRRGHKNFGNAGAVRELFESTYRRALHSNEKIILLHLLLKMFLVPTLMQLQIQILHRH
jgi:hypothetical protein